MLRLSRRFAESVRPELVIVFFLIAILGILHAVQFQQRAYLNLYFLPVVLAGFSLGRRGGVMTAAAAGCLVVWFGLLTPGSAPSGPQLWERWTDLGLWICILVSTGGLVGHLSEVNDRAFGQLARASEGVVSILGKFLETADEYTQSHSVKVAELSVAIARELGLPDDEIEDIRVAALLHDIGKVDVSRELLRKVGELDEDEWTEMRQHPENGARILADLGDILAGAVPLVLYHHERFEGNGYHDLAAEEIPLGARIISVADTYDAVTSDRAYRSARQPWKAMKIIRDSAGSQFDPAVVAAFEAVLARPSGLHPVGDEIPLEAAAEHSKRRVDLTG